MLFNIAGPCEIHSRNLARRVVWPRDKSSYFLEVRTNNDVEGWHCNLNKSKNICKTFYDVLDLLHKKAEEIPVDEACLKAGQILREQKKEFVVNDERLWELWVAFDKGEIDAVALHEEICLL